MDAEAIFSEGEQFFEVGTILGHHLGKARGGTGVESRVHAGALCSTNFAAGLAAGGNGGDYSTAPSHRRTKLSFSCMSTDTAVDDSGKSWTGMIERPHLCGAFRGMGRGGSNSAKTGGTVGGDGAQIVAAAAPSPVSPPRGALLRRPQGIWRLARHRGGELGANVESPGRRSHGLHLLRGADQRYSRDQMDSRPELKVPASISSHGSWGFHGPTD